MPSTTIRPAAEDDWPSILEQLTAAGLPTADIDRRFMTDFLVAETPQGECVAAIGCQRYGTLGLLRSLVVARLARGAGLGRRMVAQLERYAAAAGVKELWLLTIDAERFFAALGYREADRRDVPPAIGETAEFSTLCPDSAHLMRKSIG